MQVVEPVEVQMNRAEDSGELHELWLVQGQVVVARLGPLESVSGNTGDGEMDAVSSQLNMLVATRCGVAMIAQIVADCALCSGDRTTTINGNQHQCREIGSTT